MAGRLLLIWSDAITCIMLTHVIYWRLFKWNFSITYFFENLSDKTYFNQRCKKPCYPRDKDYNTKIFQSTRKKWQQKWFNQTPGDNKEVALISFTFGKLQKIQHCFKGRPKNVAIQSAHDSGYIKCIFSSQILPYISFKLLLFNASHKENTKYTQETTYDKFLILTNAKTKLLSLYKTV